MGFRPFVAELAREHGVRGHVLNDSQGVVCLAVGPAPRVRRFVAELHPRAPRLAVVEHVSVQDVATPVPEPDTFTIAASRSLPERRVHLPVDTHACADCLREMRDPQDRRFGYPFVNCTNCGPRYSIIRDVPYDRPATSMAAFGMCGACRREYEDHRDRRYHAQPIACPDCGPGLTGTDLATGVTWQGAESLRETARRLQDGQIVAVKGVGGFHLAVDARSPGAVRELRRRKRRDSKPFAVMARDLAAAARVAHLSDPERAILDAPQRPILLARKGSGAAELAELVAPRNPSVGLMLPSAPHHELLFDHLDTDFVVMTSGNVSGDPIETDNASAHSRLAAITGFVLDHDRDIVNRLDDSVVRLTDPAAGEPFFTFVRRGRGYAPYYVTAPHPVDVGIVGVGSELKATAALADGGTVYAAQHVGDMTNDATSRAHRAVVDRLAGLYGIEPKDVLSDQHTAFLERTEHLYGSALGIQHHHAHLASCLLDNGLPEATYVGVVLDGVGYGADGSMWGAEVFVGGYRDVVRVSSLRTIPLIGGDAAVRQPARIALALARRCGALAGMDVGEVAAFLGLTADELRVYDHMLSRGVNTPAVSSMGRLFDGVAALAGLARRAEYEAQGPIELEGLLGRSLEVAEPYRLLQPCAAAGGVDRLDWGPAVADTVADLLSGTALERVSRRFHTTVATSVAAQATRVARRHDVDRVALSGGVFLNEFLAVHVPRLVAEVGCTPYRHQRIPTNDGGIAPGQVAVHQARLALGDER